MRTKSVERMWCDEHHLTMNQARRLGGYLRLIELEKNYPGTLRILLADSKRMSMAHRKAVAA